MLESTAETTTETTATSPIVAHLARPGFSWRELPEGARFSVPPGDIYETFRTQKADRSSPQSDAHASGHCTGCECAHAGP